MKLFPLKCLALLLAYAYSLNWQAAGNMSSQNITVINSYISFNFSMGKENTDTSTVKASKFSDYLNDLWAPAWNVVIRFAPNANKNFDTILYGYAFRNHWLWINGLIFNVFDPTTNYYGSIIIWKDYNCNGWMTLTTSSASNTFTTDPATAISTFLQSYSLQYDDIWNIAWKAVTYLETEAADFKGDHAYTMIFSQASGRSYIGQVCASNYRIKTTKLASDSTHGDWGSYLLLQMR